VAQGPSLSPFLDVRSFSSDTLTPVDGPKAFPPPRTPFLALYELDEAGGYTDPAQQEQQTFSAELHDDELDEAVYETIAEASELCDRAGVTASRLESQRLLNQHFQPLQREMDRLLDRAADRFGETTAAAVDPNQVAEFFDSYAPDQEMQPAFENLFGGLLRSIKNVAGKAINLAKKGALAVGSFALKALFGKLKDIVKPLLESVLRRAIAGLPESLRPVATQLAQRFGLAETESDVNEESACSDNIQREFHERCGRILFAPNPIEGELQTARIAAEPTSPQEGSLDRLDQARDKLADRLGRLSQGEDPAPAFEEFLPALLPALQLGEKLIGRNRLVSGLAKLLGLFLQRFVGPQYTPPLSQAIADAGLKLFGLEVTPEDANRVARSAVIATAEDAARRLSELPQYVLDNQEMFEGAALEALEQSAAANFPAVLREGVYRSRPELRESSGLRGTWIAMPIGGRMRYKKFSRVLRTRITPEKAHAVESFGGATLAEFLEEQMGMPPGGELAADAHLYEAMPGTTLPQLARLESDVPGLGSSAEVSYKRLHPLTHHAAGVILGEPGMGRHFSPHDLHGHRHVNPGHRFYHLALQRTHPAPSSDGARRLRRHTSVKIAIDFNASEIRTRLYLAENRAQHLFLRLRQQGQEGAILAALRKTLEKKLEAALAPHAHGAVRIIHPDVPAQQATGAALKRLPAELSAEFRRHLAKWMLKALQETLKARTKEIEAAIESHEDGVSFLISFQNPPGLDLLKNAFAEHPKPSGPATFPDDEPKYTVKIVSGHPHV
jgi:hypothetical protein